MAINNEIEDVLKKLELEQNGEYDDEGFYIIRLQDSDDYAKMFTILNEKTINTEYPSFGVNDQKNTVKITNYFTTDVDNIDYNLFLIADFNKEEYYLKIGVVPDKVKEEEK